jgi:hypothetical protein
MKNAILIITSMAVLAVTSFAQQPAFVQIAASAPQSPQTSMAIPFPSAQTSGNLNVIVVGWNDITATVSSVTDSLGNTYTLAAGPTQSTGITQSIYYAKNITGGSNTVTVQFSVAAVYPDIRILEYSGVDKSNPLDVAHAATGSNGSPDSGAATTTSSGDLIVGAGTTSTSFTGPGSGFTSRIITSPDGDIAEDRVVTGSGSFSAAAPLSSSGDWVMQMAAFRAASASGVVTSISPTSASLLSGGTQQFTATVTGSANTAVTWSASAGSISNTGLFTAPNATGFTNITVTATSVADPTSSASASVTVHGPFANYPLKASANHRYYVDQNNVPFLLVGDSPQALITNLSEAQASAYFTDRAVNGFNGLWINLLCDTYTAGNANGTTFDGIAPFTSGNNPSNYDLATPNVAYFARADDMLNMAAQNGMVVFLDPIETGGWTTTLENNGTTKAFNYGVFLGTRYKNFPNIIWMSGNDFQSWNSSSTDNNLVKQVMAGIASVDSNHLQTIELNYNASYSSQDATVAQYLGTNAAYTYYETYDEVLQAYNSSPTSPVFMVESNYEFENNTGQATGTVLDERLQEYWTMTSGATGQIYGNHYTWTCTFVTQGNLDTTGVVQLQYGTALFASVPWWQLVTDQTHAVVTAGFGTYNGSNAAIGNANYATTAWIPDGSLAITYCPKQTTLTVNMAKLSGAATARWYDPTNGTYSAVSGSPFANSGSHQFATPGSNSSGDKDWVLVLSVSSSGNHPPVITTPASATPATAKIGQLVSFSVSASDADNDPLTYSWVFGDGSSATGSTTSHAYAIAGNFTATVTVSDGHGGSAGSSVAINITSPTDNPPVITSAASATPQTAIVGQTITFSAGASDPDSDPLSFFWNFGDGSSGAGSSATHAYSTAGNFTATVTVSDGRGGTASSSVIVTINVPVTASFIQQNSAVPQSPQKTVKVIYNGPQGAGDTNILAIGWNDTKAAISSVIDSSGNTYQVAAATARGTNLSQAIYYAKNIKAAAAGANAVTVTFSVSAVYPDVRVFEYSGLDATSPFDVSASHSGTGTNADSGAATTHVASELIFGAGMTFGGFGGPGSGFTVRVITSPDADIGEDKVVSAIGSYHATAPNTNDNWVMQMATFKIASSTPLAASAASTTIDLGTVKLNQRFKTALSVPGIAAIKAPRFKLSKGSKLPAGIRISGSSIGGVAKSAGTFTFDAQATSKTSGGTYTYTLTVEP